MDLGRWNRSFHVIVESAAAEGRNCWEAWKWTPITNMSHKGKVRLSITRDNGGSGDRLRGLPIGTDHVGGGGGISNALGLRGRGLDIYLRWSRTICSTWCVNQISWIDWGYRDPARRVRICGYVRPVLKSTQCYHFNL